MGVKRVNPGPKFHPKKRGKACHNDDRLSGLPDELLVVILSSLPLWEAARTSVLSSCWTNLWRNTSYLNFADNWLFRNARPHRMHINEERRKYISNEERRKYIDWVDSVIQSHKAPTLDQFRISFDSDKSSWETITTWLEFAFERRVQRLELSLTEYDIANFFKRSASVTPNLDFKSLKSLHLCCNYLRGEDIELFLHNCPFLEQLIVRHSFVSSNVEVCGSSLALKRLEIHHCNPIGATIKISAPNLTSLRVQTLFGLVLEYVPKLVELYITLFYDGDVQDLVPVLHCYSSRLEVLTLDWSNTYQDYKPEFFPEMPKLKKLGVIIFDVKSLMTLTSCIGASPLLQEFEVKVTVAKLSRKSRKVIDGITHSPHQHLKVLKFSGYFGRPTDFEFVKYFLMNCVALKKIVIDPRYKISTGQRSARNYAKRQLEAVVPSHVQLLVL